MLCTMHELASRGGTVEFARGVPEMSKAANFNSPHRPVISAQSFLLSLLSRAMVPLLSSKPCPAADKEPKRREREGQDRQHHPC